MKKILTLIIFALCLVSLFGCNENSETNNHDGYNDTENEYYLTSNEFNWNLFSKNQMEAVDLENENVKQLLSEEDKNNAKYLYEGSIKLNRDSVKTISYNGSNVNLGMLFQVVITADKSDSSTYLKVPGYGSEYKNLSSSVLMDTNNQNIYYGAAAKQTGIYDVILVVYKDYTFGLGIVKTGDVVVDDDPTNKNENIEYNEIYDSNDGVDILPTSYNLADSVQEGVILHAWNWSYETIEENLDKIASSGYSTIQVSPVQQPKDYDTSYGKGWAQQWWKFYQPVSYSIAEASWLGGKEELTSLCSAAKEKGIQIIVDIVANHSANVSDKSLDDRNTVSDEVKDYEADLYANKSQYYRDYVYNDDSSIEAVVRGNIGMPDLKTESPYVQSMIIDLLKECIDCGVTGFRFDAAKHIETPDDGTYASDFWPNILNAADSYAASNNITLYYYGEILNTPGNGRSFSSYTKYMSITDNKTGDNIRRAIVNGNANLAATSSYQTNEAANKLVLWAESHDTYANDSRESTDVSQENINKTWALVASRKDATALYFARPGEVGSIGSYSFMSNEVSAVNNFHNQFIGADEKVYSSKDYAIVERYSSLGSGIVIVNCNGTSSNVSIAVTNLTDGTYIDEITGNTFTVSSGNLSGNMGSTGIVVLSSIQTDKTPVITLSQEGGFYSERLSLTVGLSFATSARVIIGGEAHIITETTTFEISNEVNNFSTLDVTVCAVNDNYRVTKEYEFLRLDGVDSSYIVVNDVPEEYFTTDGYELYAWVWESGKEGRAIKVTVVGNYVVFSVKPNEKNFLLATHPTGYTQFQWLYVKHKTNDFLVSDNGIYNAGADAWTAHVN